MSGFIWSRWYAMSTHTLQMCIRDMAFSHFYPAMHGALISTALIATGMLLYDWRMALALLWVVPASLLMVYLLSLIHI